MALFLSGVVLYVRWEDPQRKQQPRVESTVLTEPGRAGAGIAPEISTLIARREELDLSAQQVAELRRLHAEWERVSAADRADAERAAAQFREWMDQAQERGRVAMTDVQQHGVELSERSARIARQRRAYWESALKLLSEEQRARSAE